LKKSSQALQGSLREASLLCRRAPKPFSLRGKALARAKAKAEKADQKALLQGALNRLSESQLESLKEESLQAKAKGSFRKPDLAELGFHPFPPRFEKLRKGQSESLWLYRIPRSGGACQISCRLSGLKLEFESEEQIPANIESVFRALRGAFLEAPEGEQRKALQALWQKRLSELAKAKERAEKRKLAASS
jgi:hypothetical protein